MIEIRSLTSLSEDEMQEIAGGYTSPARYAVRKEESVERTVITLELTQLDSPYIKHWERSDAQEFKRYQQYVAEGYSLGAYEGDRLVGIALAEPRRWSRSLWVWEFHVAETHRRRRIGRLLMDAMVEKAHQAGFRNIGLETQSTNVPAIAFYRAVGFEIEALDLSFYTNTDAIDGEVAIFMKRKWSPS
jgi:ribosomal protein S18 acetylase RimI-like enzyme